MSRILSIARVAGLLLLPLLASACQDDPTGSNPRPEPQARPLGLVEVTLSGIGTTGMSASASVPGKAGPRFSLSGPGNGDGSGNGSIQLDFLSSGSFTEGTRDGTGMRYLYATFRVRNAQGDGTAYDTQRQNLTFFAASTPSTIGGTPVSLLRRFDGSNADAATAPTIVPTGAVERRLSGQIGSRGADVLQVITEGEAAAVDVSGTAITSLFPYGFVVRNATDASRTLAASPGPDQYDGVVTFAFKVPLQATSAEDPFTVSMMFLAVDDSETRITQSLEEQDADGQSALEGRAGSIAAMTVTLLPGGAYTGAIPTRTLCDVRTAGSSGSPSARTAACPAVATVEVSPASLSLAEGGNGRLTATTRDAGGTALTGPVVSWSSSNTSVATVDANGQVSAVAAGTATISATVNGAAGTAGVTVSQPVAARALQFDGSNDVVTVSTFAQAGGAFTVEGWVRTTGTQAQYAGIWNRDDGTNRSWKLGFTADRSTLRFDVHNTSSSVAVTSTAGVADGRWHHVAGVYDGTNVLLYVDGVLQSQTALGGALRTSTAAFRMGTDACCAGRFLNGQVDEVRVWSAALDAATLQGWRKVQVTSSHPNFAALTAYYPLDETSGTTAPDASGNARHGTLTNGPAWVQRTGSVTVSPTSVTLLSGGTQQLTANASDLYGETVPVTWSSSDASIASVDGTGLVTAGSTVGTAAISATTPQGVGASASVTTRPPPTVLFVDAGATGANNGLSWTDAFTDLQSALSVAIVGDEIWVAAGTYKPSGTGDRLASFRLKSGVALYGGFAGTETTRGARDPQANVTTLSGDLAGNDNGNVTYTETTRNENSYHVLVAGGTDATAVLDGFTVTGGHATGTNAEQRGGGLLMAGGSPTVTSVTFQGNVAHSGGGVHNAVGSPSLVSVQFRNNWAQHGGGMSNQSGNPRITSSHFVQNRGYYGPGFRTDNGSPVLTNILVRANRADYSGGGILLYNGTPRLNNVTIQGNSVISGSGGGVEVFYANPVLYNTIIWGNTASTAGSEGLYLRHGTADNIRPRVENSILQSACPTGDRNFICINVSTADPLFVDAANANLRLGAGSPALDTGNNTFVPAGLTTDLDGNARIVNTTVDMGAYEKQP